jgi:hypothetical protein
LVLAATAEGKALVNRAAHAVEGVDEAFFGPLGERRAGFTKALRTLRG